jgi:formate dehydrogenase major subunit
MSRPAWRRWNASIVHDLFLNETANYAHVFLPGSTFLEKDGTFTNAERRINRVRKVMAPKQRLCRLGSDPDVRQCHGRELEPTPIPPQIMDEIADHAQLSPASDL